MQLKAYVNWVHHIQQDSDPNGIDVRGEPKVSQPCLRVQPGFSLL